MNIRNSAGIIVVTTALLITQSCKPKYQLANSEKNLLPVSNVYPSDSLVLSHYKPYKLKLDSIMNDVVGFSEIEIQKEKPEGPLNNFFADAMFSSAKIKGIAFDVAYTNYGGLRTPIPKGEIQKYKIFELMPFENAITTVKFKGEDMQNFFDYVARSGGDAISGARFTIDNDKATEITINGAAFDASREYIVLTSDYMANGGDGGEVFTKSLETKNYDYKLRDALLDYLELQKKAGKTLNPVKDGRVRIK